MNNRSFFLILHLDNQKKVHQNIIRIQSGCSNRLVHLWAFPKKEKTLS